MIGNYQISAGCTWNENSLSVPATGYCVSENTFNPAADGSFTVSVCFKAVTLATNKHICIICQGQAYGLAANAKDKFCVEYYNGKLIVRVKKASSTSSGNIVSIECDTVLTNDNNYVIDLVVNSSSIKVYVNGKLDKQADYTYTSFTCTAKVGLNCTTNDNGYKAVSGGALNYYALNFYDRALSAEEIETNFNTYNTRFSVGL